MKEKTPKRAKVKKKAPKKVPPIRKLLPPKVKSKIGLRVLRAAVKKVQKEQGRTLPRPKAWGAISTRRLHAAVKAVKKEREKQLTRAKNSKA